MTDASGTTKTVVTVFTATQSTDKDAEESNVSKKDKLSQKEKEILVVHDQGFFQHSTGDTYDGYFEAKKKDHALKMHGEVLNN